jgi:Fe-S-cluster containining protein
MEANDPFYRPGLRFFCTRCNKCCRHESGYVFLSEKDITRLSRGLSLSVDEFLGTYTKKIHFGFTSRVSLLEQKNFDCIFWKDGGCSVYEHRPLQCRAFPFWPQNLDSEESWEETASECPGVHLGPRHGYETILDWLDQRKKEPFFEPK